MKTYCVSGTLGPGKLRDLSHRVYILLEAQGQIKDKLASEIISGDEHHKENKMKQGPRTDCREATVSKTGLGGR